MPKKENGPCIEVKNLSYFYNDGNDKFILKDISFSLQKGEILAVLGPNGCGKTTLINLIARFLKPKSGNITYYNNGTNPLFSSVVFQDLALFDWKNAFKNIEMSLISTIKNPSKRKETVEKYLHRLNINNHKGKLPKQLSGGLKQRVAVARALAPNPELLLLDEPFSALDLPSKERLKEDLLRIIRKENKSVIIITHDIEEAVMFSDRILIIIDGGYEIIEVKSSAENKSQIKKAILIKFNGGR